MTKPICVWVSPAGPSPWKVVFVLEELGIPYEVESIRIESVKMPPFININPNGRVPAIEDPNTDIAVWESGAIVEYLVKQYDTERRISFDSLKEQVLCGQWLAFQISGQGPYFGQCTWFKFLHPEKIPSAIERYTGEIKRVLGVLDGALAAKPEGKRWLVGERMSYADMAFVPWNDRLDAALGVPVDQMFSGFPHVQGWHESMVKRISWVKSMELRARLLDEQGFDSNGMPKSNKDFQEHEQSIAAADQAAADQP